MHCRPDAHAHAADAHAADAHAAAGEMEMDDQNEVPLLSLVLFRSLRGTALTSMSQQMMQQAPMMQQMPMQPMQPQVRWMARAKHRFLSLVPDAFVEEL